MRIYDSSFASSLTTARDGGIAPIWFAHFNARNRVTDAVEPLGLWSGDEDITVSVQAPSGGLISRSYIGGCNLSVEGIQHVIDLTDNAITINMSQIADATQQLVRGYDVRFAEVEIHATTWNGGIFASVPQLQWVGIVDEAPIATPAVGGDGSISMSVRDEIMAMLTTINPAKSSDAHQKRRRAGDLFCQYSSTISSRKVQWYLRDE